MRDVAREAWLETSARVGNASSLHGEGRAARAVVEDARERIAAALGAHPTEVIFTSGATEANNLALKGLAWSAPRGARLVTSAVEHHAVLDPARWLHRQEGYGLAELPVDDTGVVSLAALRHEVDHAKRRDPVALIAIQWVNNEVGAIQPLAQVIEAAGEVPVHSDAAQAVAHLPVDFGASGLTSLAVSAHKLGGPVGVGALLVRRDARLTPVIHGGGQERQVRSGTLDAAGIAAFAAAVDEAVAGREAQAARLGAWRAQLVAGIVAAVPDAVVAGAHPSASPGIGEGHAPHIVHAVIPGAPAEALLFLLDQAGIAASSGSACTAGVVQSSHVLLAMGHSEARAAQALRLSLGHTSTQDDVEAVLALLPEAVDRARRAASPR